MATAVESTTGEKKKRRRTVNKGKREINNRQDNPAEVLVAPGPAPFRLWLLPWRLSD